MKIAHKKLGVEFELPELKQRDVETFFAKLREDGAEVSGPEYAGRLARAAASVGWLNGVGDIGDMKPAVVVWLSSKLNEYIAEALTIPPE